MVASGCHPQSKLQFPDAAAAPTDQSQGGSHSPVCGEAAGGCRRPLSQ